MEIDSALQKVLFHNPSDCSNYKNFLIAGDVSATNILIGVYTQTPEGSREIFKAVYNGQKIPAEGFNKYVLMDTFCQSGINSSGIEKIVLAPAGPIEGKKRVQMTRAKFYIDASEIGFPCALINDFAAKAYAVSGAKEGKIELETVSMNELAGLKGKTIEKEPIHVGGVGTGFGNAGLMFINGRYQVAPSEGGHEFLAIDPDNQLEVELAQKLKEKRNGFLPHWESVLSGQGLCDVHEFLKRNSGVSSEYSTNDSHPELIAKIAKNNQNTAEAKALYYMYEVFGRALRSESVNRIATGGIYASGGMIKRDIIMLDGSYNMELVKSFMKGFLSGPTHKNWADKINIEVILDFEDGLKGALHVAQTDEFFEKECYRVAA
jgi:glucokinase